MQIGSDKCSLYTVDPIHLSTAWKRLISILHPGYGGLSLLPGNCASPRLHQPAPRRPGQGAETRRVRSHNELSVIARRLYFLPSLQKHRKRNITNNVSSLSQFIRGVFHMWKQNDREKKKNQSQFIFHKAVIACESVRLCNLFWRGSTAVAWWQYLTWENKVLFLLCNPPLPSKHSLFQLLSSCTATASGNEGFVVKAIACFFFFFLLDNVLSSVKLSICQCFNHQTGSIWVTLVFKQFLGQARRHNNWLLLKTVFSICRQYFKPRYPPLKPVLGLLQAQGGGQSCHRGREKKRMALWIAVRSTKLWQHWLTWQWIHQYIYH